MSLTSASSPAPVAVLSTPRSRLGSDSCRFHFVRPQHAACMGGIEFRTTSSPPLRRTPCVSSCAITAHPCGFWAWLVSGAAAKLGCVSVPHHVEHRFLIDAPHPLSGGASGTSSGLLRGSPGSLASRPNPATALAQAHTPILMDLGVAGSSTPGRKAPRSACRHLLVERRQPSIRLIGCIRLRFRSAARG